MAERGFEIAVFGSTAFAGLLAGQLAAAHGKRVCLVGDRWSPYRLPRRFNVSASVATRPATWALLKREIPESLKLLGAIGRGLYERVDPLFVAESPETVAVLGHMRWMALGHGFAAERAVDPAITGTGSICRIRDAAMLIAAKAGPAIEGWLDRCGVARFAPAEASLTPRRDGTATLGVGSGSLDVGSVVLGDEEAILARLPEPDRHRLLTVTETTGVLIEPAGPLGGPLVSYLDRDLALHQRNAKAPIAAIALGHPHAASERIAASIPSKEPLRRNGRCLFRTVTVADGAPLVGRLGRNRATIIAGLGPAAAFLAPVVARVVAGAASEDEKRYFEAREPVKSAARTDVADWCGGATEGAAP